MKHSFRLILATAVLLSLTACENEKVDLLKSPCVGLDTSPCGPKRLPTGNTVYAPMVEQA